MRFKIECVLEPRIGVVIAQQLDEGNFTVAKGSTLGGVELTPTLDMPRSLDSDGNQRKDVFVFRPCSEAYVTHFEVGDVVELVSPDA
jgi:hypothetical protein